MLPISCVYLNVEERKYGITLVHLRLCFRKTKFESLSCACNERVKEAILDFLVPCKIQ